MIVLDTNIISELSIARPNQNVADWIGRINLEQLYLCTPVVSELAYGAQLFFQRTGSSRYISSLNKLLSEQFIGRILGFDTHIALCAGELRAIREANGRTVRPMDLAIAAIAKSNNATLATRDTRDFDGLDLKLINPFEAQ